jgi:hypothetical protein
MARRRREYETQEFLALLERLIRRAGERVGDGDEPELARLLALEGKLAEAIQEAVDRQRAIGRSWDAIALATGKSRQAAYQRWGLRGRNAG